MSFLDLDERLHRAGAGRSTSSTARSSTPRSSRRTSTSRSSRARSATRTTSTQLAPDPRAHARSLVAFGDCAVTGNVHRHAQPARQGRATCSTAPTSRTSTSNPRIPAEPGIVPPLLDRGAAGARGACRWTSSCPAARRRPTRI
ncbi:MAG: hypothetical protein MZV65_18560 [Chromatiales bacterium]|nr:hypothetical protein [Chromatiales bacterium]